MVRKIISQALWVLYSFALYLLVTGAIFFLVITLIGQYGSYLISWLVYGEVIDDYLWTSMGKSFLSYAPKTELIGLNKVIEFAFGEIGRVIAWIGLSYVWVKLADEYVDEKEKFKNLVKQKNS